jgi:UDP-N-acetylglucosamine 4-epimerase
MDNTAVYINGDGEQTRDFTFVDNAVQANIKGMLCDNDEAYGNVYNIAVGERFTVKVLYESVREILEIDHQPTYREPRAGDIRNSLADTSKANRLLGYAPTERFMEGLKRTVEYFKQQYS